MYKLLIVDDDVIIRTGLAKSTDWAANGFEVIGVAENGEAAMDLIAANEPDILISDIKMPFMDGVELAAAVYRQYPQIKIILLSAYAEFSYAKKALESKVFNYLLKPVDASQLLEVVRQAADEISKQQEIRLLANRGITLARQRFLQNLAIGSFPEKEPRAQLQELCPRLAGDEWIALSVYIDDYYGDGFNRSALDGELLRQAVLAIAAELLEVLGRGEILEEHENRMTIFIAGSRGDTLLTCAARFAEELRVSAEKRLSSTLTIGVGCACDSLETISRSCRESRNACASRHIVGKNKVVLFSDMDHPALDDDRAWLLEGWDTQFIEAAINGKEDEANAILHRQQARIARYRTVSLENIRLLAIGAVALLLREVGSWSDFDINTDYYQICQQVYRTNTLDDTFSLLRDLSKNVCAAINDSRKSSRQEIAEQARRYVQENFTVPGLSLQQVSAQFYISPVYLSIIFKECNGINFFDYLCQLRMEKAASLLRGSGLKAYQVAERVGYSNPSYFSVAFKKYFGCSVSYYRSKVKYSNGEK